MPLPAIITKLFAGGASKIIETVSSTIDEFTLSKEEKEKFKAAMLAATNQHIEAMATLAQAETDSYLKDMDSARGANARIQESDKASWMSKNVGYLLDLSVAILFYAMLFLIFFVEVPEKNKEIFYTAFGILGAKYGSSFDFHRGSSRGSEDKSKQIGKMVEAANK